MIYETFHLLATARAGGVLVLVGMAFCLTAHLARTRISDQ